jgi:hypothetical protein
MEHRFSVTGDISVEPAGKFAIAWGEIKGK